MSRTPARSSRVRKDGTDEFECGGLMKFPGWPFCISATNVN